MQIQNKYINEESPCFIIAEAGVNHGGDLDIAKKLIEVAAESGADAVKFQAFKTDELILKTVEKAVYQKKTTSSSESQFEMLKKLELTKNQNAELKLYCSEKKIIFLTTPFDEASLHELDELNLPAYKIASTDTTNIPFLRAVAKKGKPIFLSTGMSYFSEIEIAVREILKINKQLILLQCTANYPIEDKEANLNVMHTFKRHFGLIVGYSDHTAGVGASPYAVAAGAKVVEKHFTINKFDEGPDHKASLSPDELKLFVQEVRRVEQFLGDGIKIPTSVEQGTRISLQKCIVAKEDISIGEVFSDKNLTTKRTGGIGILPIYYDNIIGKVAEKKFLKNEIIFLT